MDIISTVSRYLLGLMFTVFGANGFLHFLHQPPPTSKLAGDFFTVMFVSHYLVVPFAFQLVAGLLLLAGRYVPMALIFLAAILVNIFTFHITMDPGGLAPGIVAAILWVLVAVKYRERFAGVLQP